MAFATGFLWAAGWIEANDLVSDSSFDIGNFPRQADMYAGIDWQRPDNDADNVDDNAEIVKGTNGYSAGYGGQSLKWALRGLRPMMVAWIVANKFPGGAYTYQATIAVPLTRRSGVVKYFQALATRTEYTKSELQLGGLDRWVINFDDAQEITPPSMLLTEASASLLTEDGKFLETE